MTAAANMARGVVNRWFDRMADAYRKPTRAEQKAALRVLENDSSALLASLKKKELFTGSAADNNVLFEQGGQFVIGLLLKPPLAFATAEDHAQMRLELDKLGFALAGYRADHDSYPSRLSELTLKYSASIPKDAFTNGELQYRRQADGFVLYSVGSNGRDDGARGIDDVKANEDWNDLVVRVPPLTTQGTR